ncbi:sulfite exporter TauE/SafE family protein 3-like [Humulus lupulus]|uniref:sulfite exporter TauE/SafE family protein 3-like n=1 Tax=Humulus lupulus TaxID=3486 RepID=UPI002B40AEF8|nr:sulfite exporter TauE/SafE family protein 3-like [Humulus lupulus]
MAKKFGPKWCNNMRVIGVCMIGFLVVASSVLLVSGNEISTAQKAATQEIYPNYVTRVSNNSSHPNTRSGYIHVWPDMKFGWKIVVGGIIGFLGAAFGSVEGVGGGGTFVLILTLIIGFDEKSSTAISKCMVMGGAAATVLYNLRQRHPTLDFPIIDYDLALLFQPMLMLGITIGVSFNVIFADWMIILLLIIVLLSNAIGLNIFLPIFL